MPINFLKQIVEQECAILVNGDWIRKSPSKDCEDYIEGFYLFNEIESKSDHCIFNDGFPTIVLFPKRDNNVCINTDTKSNLVKSGWVDFGVIKKVYVKYIEDLEYILVIRFKPESFHKIFKLSSPKNIMTLLEMNLPQNLLDKIFETNSIERKIEIIELFVKSLIPKNAKTGLLNSAVALINQSKGRLSVADLARCIKVNYKWLERNFTKYIGLTPKEYIQLQRFISAYVGLHNKSTDLLDVALTNGYYDYNHYLKEFKDFTGKTPMEYISNKRYLKR